MSKTPAEFRYLDALFFDSDFVELRAIKRGHTPKWSWHNDTQSLVAQARKWAGEGVLLCTTMGKPLPDAVNRSLRDDGVSDYCRLLFDFDRKDKAAENASDDELAEAGLLRDNFVEHMRDLGWTEPALASSGNGLHVQYRVTAPPTFELHGALDRMYQVLSDTFQSERFKLDTTTRNAAQACRLYGALNRKFPPTEGSPQRIATIELPDSWMDSRFQLSDWMLEHYPPPPKPKLSLVPIARRPGSADWYSLDIVRWFIAKGLYLKPLSTGKHAAVCPWQAQGAHDKTSYSDTVIWETSQSGFPSFHCSHDTCAGRGSLVQLNSVMGDINDFCGGQ
jgi:hypothetical protein